MRSKRLIGLIFGIVCLVMIVGISYGESLKIQDIIDNNGKLRNEAITVSGKIEAVVYRETSNVVSVNMKKDTTKKKALETNIYLVSDETAGIYIISTNHYDKKQTVTFQTNILMNSDEKAGNDQAILYDKYVSAKSGLSSPDYSLFNLEMLLKNMPKDKDWVLLIDIE